jgi:hypothetical protein
VPSVGTVDVLGSAPVIISGKITVPTGTLVEAGSVPSVVVSGKVITVPVRAVNITGVAPSRVVSRVITPPKGALTLVGGTATLSNANWNIIDTSQTPNWVQIAA